MNRLTKALAGGVVLLLTAGPSAFAEGDHDDHEYQEVSCPGDVGDTQVMERREHHTNGRTECVIADDPTGWICREDAMKDNDDCSFTYDPYQEDMEEGNSNGDRGPALRYHNGDKYLADAHHGGAGCFDTDPATTLTPAEADRAGKAALQAVVGAELAGYTGDAGMANALADGWYMYPVPESKQFHMVRVVGAGDRYPEQPKALWAPNIESFVLGMTDDGWQVMNGMFMLGNDGPADAPMGTDGRYAAGEYDYKWIDDESKLPAWDDPASTLACDLMWHGHKGEQGVATSFETEYPDVSPWMAHVGIYAAAGDPFAQERMPDSSEPHAYWEPYRHIPALCNPSGPCE